VAVNCPGRVNVQYFPHQGISEEGKKRVFEHIVVGGYNTQRMHVLFRASDIVSGPIILRARHGAISEAGSAADSADETQLAFLRPPSAVKPRMPEHGPAAPGHRASGKRIHGAYIVR
jgi:hypothetical protein